MRSSQAGAGRGTLFFAVFALVVSAGCVRLGIWQLSRHSERKARNAEVVARLALPPATVGQLAGDTAARFRRTAAQGRYDYDREFILVSRPRNGAPGVHIVTPLLVGDTAVLVNRGWVYAPDGMRITDTEWREDSIARVEGYAERLSAGLAGDVSTPSVANGLRRLDLDSVRTSLPYPVHQVVIVQRLDSGEATATSRGHPVRVEPPPLDSGPHLAYAVQWFAFSLVGIVGTALVLARDRGRAVPGASVE